MQSTRSTAPAIDTQAVDPPELKLSGRLSLRQRILAVNIFAILLLAGSFFYLDSYRTRLIDERVAQAQQQAGVIAAALTRLPPADRTAFLGQVGSDTRTRFRIAADERLIADSWAASGPSFRLRDPADEPWQRHAARLLDDAIETVVDAGDPILFTGFAPPSQWPGSGAGWKLARDRTHMIWATAKVRDGLLLSETNARDIRRLVRAERSRLGIVIAVISALSILLSLFLARTIEQPLRALAKAAQRVRFGRDREVKVPRLPTRRDEIGLLARALSDMSHALRERIDATEAFAADVAHELKNPLASLSSAAQGLRTVKQPELRAQLEAIIEEDVLRLDRLITDISELSRLDARLARTRFEAVDLGALLAGLVKSHETRRGEEQVQLAVLRTDSHSTVVRGDAAQLTRVFDNLISNAISFSPPGTVVQTALRRDGAEAIVTVEDSGPGIPESAREAIFERFHSDRPAGEDFGTHSGLGLAIARAIVEGHDGSITADSRDDASGARFVVRLPIAQ